jgi:hypothetical protein
MDMYRRPDVQNAYNKNALYPSNFLRRDIKFSHHQKEWELYEVMCMLVKLIVVTMSGKREGNKG